MANLNNLVCDCVSICPDIKRLREIEKTGEDPKGLYEDLVNQYDELCSKVGTDNGEYCLTKKELKKI
jgi:hypothetical protein